MGLVETGVGLFLRRRDKGVALRWIQDSEFTNNHDEAALRVFDIIGYGLTAHSPLQAKKYKFFLDNDVIVLNRDNLLDESFNQVAILKNNYVPPPVPHYCLSGQELKEKMREHLLNLEKKGIIFGYDVEIGLNLATVLSGADTDKSKTLSEDDLYNLERQTLINLIQSQKTRDRIHAMLLNGRRLKN